MLCGMVHNQLVPNNHLTKAEASTSLAILFVYPSIFCTIHLYSIAGSGSSGEPEISVSWSSL